MKVINKMPYRFSKQPFTLRFLLFAAILQDFRPKAVACRPLAILFLTQKQTNYL